MQVEFLWNDQQKGSELISYMGTCFIHRLLDRSPHQLRVQKDELHAGRSGFNTGLGGIYIPHLTWPYFSYSDVALKEVQTQSLLVNAQ